MATAQSNPCGLSLNTTLNIIKDKVLTGNYNGRNDVIQGLMGEGYSYSEANQVADYYYSIYNRIAGKQKISTPVLLSGEQRSKKKLNNLAVSYLKGDTGSFPLSDADVSELENIYEKWEKADTPTLKAKFEEQAKRHVAKFLPGYTDELFKSGVYAKPLLSGVFFIKSILSNVHSQVERYITNIWDGKRVDFTQLWKFSNLSDTTGFNVLQGGVPATNLYQNENTLHTGARLEEFALIDTPANSNQAKRRYFSAMKFLTKWSNRFNAAPDSWGIFANAERHLYQLLKEKYRDLGLTPEQANQHALQDMELDDLATATQMAKAKFDELGVPTKNKNGKPTGEFNVAVAEYQRIHRDDVLWSRALNLSKNDFWKRNMTQRSQLGFGDYGLFGLKAQVLAKVRDVVEKGGKNKKQDKLTSSFNLFAFGFLNGAANFAEDALERFPLYAAVKWGALQYTKGNVTDKDLASDIGRRQQDLVVKNILTATFFLAAKAVESAVCPERSGKASSVEISGGRTQIGVCGVPAIVPPQMMAMFKVYNVLWQTAETESDFWQTVGHIFPILVQSNQMGLGGSLDKLTANASEYFTADRRGDKIKREEALVKGTKSVIDAGTGLANSFIPIPARLLNEAAVITNKVRGVTQKQQKLPFATDEMGKPLGFWNTAANIGIHSLGNVTGVSEIMMAAFGSKKEYAMDWQGRRVMQMRGSDIIGSGIRYNEYDDIIRKAGVKTPYVSRLQRIEYDGKKESTKNYYGRTVKEAEKNIRYMTDEEYFNVHKALGKFNKEHFEQYSDKMIKDIKADRDRGAKNITGVFNAARKKAVEAIEKGITDSDGIYKYVKKNWKGKDVLSRTSTDY